MNAHNFIDITGHLFGRLAILRRVENSKDGQSRFLCKCECGNEKVIQGRHLRSGKISSCGCLNKALVTKRNTTHGMRGSRLYIIWAHMLQRCDNPKNQRFMDYGGRGIAVCDAWYKFENFYSWAMTNGYLDDLTVERKNNNGNYEPNNCKWATVKEQNSNSRHNRIIEFNGQRKTLAQWATIHNINQITLWYRLHRNWPIEKAITQPAHR